MRFDFVAQRGRQTHAGTHCCTTAASPHAYLPRAVRTTSCLLPWRANAPFSRCGSRCASALNRRSFGHRVAEVGGLGRFRVPPFSPLPACATPNCHQHTTYRSGAATDVAGRERHRCSRRAADISVRFARRLLRDAACLPAVVPSQHRQARRAAFAPPATNVAAAGSGHLSVRANALLVSTPRVTLPTYTTAACNALRDTPPPSHCRCGTTPATTNFGADVHARKTQTGSH